MADPKRFDLSSPTFPLDKLELTNYVSLVHQTVVAEVKSIMDGLHLDFSKVNTTTRGFLNLS